nr:trigger factor [Desulfobacterales bacterium]
MKVEVQDVTTVKKVLNVEIPEEDVTRQLDKVCQELRRTVMIRGFRPGKVPRSIIEQRFRKEINAEVSAKLISDSLTKALEEVKLVPLGEPDIERPNIEKGRAYRYSATIEILPEIDDIDFNGLRLKKNIYSVKETDIEEELKRIQKTNAQLNTVEENRPVQKGDFVVIDYEGFKDGKPFVHSKKVENFLVEVGSGHMLEEFENNLLGMLPDTHKDIPVHFPEDYYNKNLAGNDITFKVHLKEIKEQIIPELDDEFAKDIGYESLDKLKKAIEENLQKRNEMRSNQELETQILEALSEKTDFELPETMVNEELRTLVDNRKNAFSRRGLSLEDTGESEEEFAEKYRSLAERNVRNYLILKKIIDQEKITVSDELLDEEYKKIADSTNQPVEMIKAYHEKHKESLETFKWRILRDQAIKLILEKSAIENIEKE